MTDDDAKRVAEIRDAETAERLGMRASSVSYVLDVRALLDALDAAEKRAEEAERRHERFATETDVRSAAIEAGVDRAAANVAALIDALSAARADLARVTEERDAAREMYDARVAIAQRLVDVVGAEAVARHAAIEECIAKASDVADELARRAHQSPRTEEHARLKHAESGALRVSAALIALRDRGAK